MAIIPNDEKVIMVSSTANTIYSGSKALKETAEWYTMQDIVDTVDGGGGGLPYKVYTARVAMGDGSATVFENTLGVTITWTAFPGSISTGTVGGLIGQNNVYVQVSSDVSTSSPKIVSANFAPAPWRVVIEQTDNAGAADNTQSVNVEIRIYT